MYIYAVIKYDMEAEKIICTNCGSVDDYEIRVNLHKTAYCNSCGKYIKHIRTQPAMLYVGKYAHIPIERINDLDYLIWAYSKMNNLSSFVKEAINNRIKILKSCV